MSYVSVYKCDSCGKTAEGISKSGRQAPGSRVPEGWMFVQLGGAEKGTPQKHICETCSSSVFRK